MIKAKISPENLTGIRFGKLTVISRLPYVKPPGFNKHTMGEKPYKYKVQCECGFKFVLPKSHLVEGRPLVCGPDCVGPDLYQNWGVPKEVAQKYKKGLDKKKRVRISKKAESYFNPFESKKVSSRNKAIDKVLNVYKNSAKNRELEWALSREHFVNLITSPCHYSGFLPSKEIETKGGSFFWTGIDRKDSSKGYTPDNVVSCHEFANYAKRNRSYEAFIEWLDQLVAYRNSLNESDKTQETTCIK